MRHLNPLLPLGGFLLSILALACNSDSSPPATEDSLQGSISVFAAASLTDAFTELSAEFERDHPGVKVEFNFAGSPTLRTQLEQGARGDVYASADLAQMQLARQNGVIAAEQAVFARNSLVVITPASNPGRILNLTDLRRPGVKLVLANSEVPVGAYARQMLANLERDAFYGTGFSDAVLRNTVSLESNVRQVVAKVELGEADAGIVYGTDVTPALASKIRKLAVPDQHNVIAEYPIALTKDARNLATAGAFIKFVLSPRGEEVFKKYGFQSPG